MFIVPSERDESVYDPYQTSSTLSPVLNASSTGHSRVSSPTLVARPYFGDAFISFQNVYWPIHCVSCLVICTLGIFANVTNIVVLTRPNMITAVNTILSAMAFSDLIVNISNIPYLMHELSDSSNSLSFFSYQWALYILFHAHITVTAHTISIWLTCVLATWRYFVVCRSTSSNQRNWSVTLAKQVIVGVFLFVFVICIPNYLSFAIVKEVTESNNTIYKVGFSHLADESQFIKTFHFWIFSCLTKLVPCVLLTFFTTVLIMKLLSARERRLRLATFDNHAPHKDIELSKQTNNISQQARGDIALMITNGSTRQDCPSKELARHSKPEPLTKAQEDCNGNAVSKGNYFAQQIDPFSQPDADLLANSCRTSTSALNGNEANPKVTISNQPRMMIVESDTNNSNNKVLTTALPNRVMASCDIQKHIQTSGLVTVCDAPRSASTCGRLDLYSTNENLADLDNQPLVHTSLTASQDLPGINNADPMRRSEKSNRNMSESNLRSDKRFSGSLGSSRGRSAGSGTLGPIQLVKLHTSQRQLSQNETTTRLLIAVMIVFLICEFPAGILAALCAILGQDFFENVYQPTGILTDLLALINSSVNFILYCFMSTQFRTTFYRVVLHCPAPNAPQ